MARKLSRLETALAHPWVWSVASVVYQDLVTNRGDVLADYVRLKGNVGVDWVWLEERLGDALADVQYAQFSQQDSHDAAFALVIAAIQIKHPQVQGSRKVLDLLREPMPIRTSMEVIRDAFLEGRDQDAIALLLAEVQSIFVYWNPDFWLPIGKGRPYVDVHKKTTYTALGLHDGIDGCKSPHEAVGFAIQMFVDWKAAARVDISQMLVPETKLDSNYDDMTIFAIAESHEALERQLKERA